MLYKGSNKIQDTGAYGVYVGNIPIDRIYKGSEKVYQYHPYTPGQVLFFVTGQAQETITLPFGVYNLAVTGGGGNGAFTPAGGYVFSASGGAGATWEGTFYIPNTATLVLFAGGAVEASYINVNGARFITAGNGGNGGYGDGGAGGVLTVASTSVLQNITPNEETTGNGTAGYGYPGGTNSVSSKSSYGWGSSTGYNTGGVPAGHYQQGGFRLEFVRRYL